MAARSVPPQPTFTTSSEHEVWQRLMNQLGDGSVVISGLRLTSEQKDHEIDLLVLMPGYGLVVIEVKGSHVWADEEGWWITRDGRPAPIDPVTQALEAKYALFGYLKSDPRWSGGRVLTAHHVVLAKTVLADDFATADCPRWQISGQNDLGDLGQRLRDQLEIHTQRDAAPPSAMQIALIEEILAGRGLPARDQRAEADDRADLVNRLTREQSALLDVTRLLNRVEVRGGAGSGKTVMAIEQARRLARGHRGTPAQRTAVLCYSYGLATHLQRELETGSRKKRPRFVGTFEDLGNLWGVPSGTREDSEYWEVTFPQLMAERARELPPGQRFDSIVVDEAQDFAESWWTPLLLALADEQTGGLFAYTDEHQRVFPRFGRPPVALVPLVLDHNLRNTRQIAECFLPLAPSGMEIRGAAGPEVSFFPTTSDQALDVADDQVEVLFDEGWDAGDIALITTGRRHPVQIERQASLGQRDYWQQFWDSDDIFYGHVLGFKGMERRAVVLCVNEAADRDRGAERLYVGLSRATDRLIVVGDPAIISRNGGPEVAAELGITPLR